MRTIIHPDTTGVLNSDAGSTVKRSLLDCGVRVLTEHMPGQRSVSLGLWIAVGSRDEDPGQLGSTHFLEHLLFKGTRRRSALDIATAFDEVGGDTNALTGKEHTCYYARVLDTDLPMAVAVLTDMVTSALIAPDDLETERGVILEELAMAADDLEEVAHEHFCAQVLQGHPLGRPVGATPADIAALTRNDVAAHFQRWYCPEELVVTAAGGVEHEQLCALVTAALENSAWDLGAGVAPAPRRIGQDADINVRAGREKITRSSEQSHVIVGGSGPGAADPDRFAQALMHAILGGSMSSRLFQEVREKRGLAYSTYSYSSMLTDTGYYGLYAGCVPHKVDATIAVLQEQLERIATTPVQDHELKRGKGQLRGATVLGMEDTAARMSRLGQAELVRGEFVDTSDALARLAAVSAEDVLRIASRLYASPQAITVVGA